MTVQDLTLADGRTLRTWVAGDLSGLTLVFHSGTPAGITPEVELSEACAAEGIGLVGMARPGYTGSTRLKGRTVASVVADTDEVLGQLGCREVVALGWSGGGPHSLACAALLPSCRAAATLAGAGPDDTDLDLDAGMAPDNVEEFAAARAGEATLRPWLDQVRTAMRSLDDAALIDAMGELLPDADRASLAPPERTAAFAASFRDALADGVDGWLDDDLAFVTPWGFDVASIAVPVAVWQGDQDTMVPLAHGHWLAEHVPTAEAHWLPGDGHMSAGYEHMTEIVRDLIALAGR